MKRKVRPLSNKAITHNSGDDLWNYLYYGVRLPNMDYDDLVAEEESDWFDEGIKWIQSELIDGEMYEVMDNPTYIFTSIGRFANIKYQTFRRLTLQCHTIQGNRGCGVFSMTKEVRDRWGIDLVYDDLPKEAKDLITHSIRTTQIKGKIGRPRKETI